ncbi:MAG: hypothetical protein OSA95_01330 [Opitutales bacterium]|nr:hypothetical protein [Opitutales bacterium]
MKIQLFALFLLFIAPWPALAAPPDPAAKKSVSWQQDELCQFVFFAVLEGLYRDGIQNEVVDAVIGEKISKKEDKMKTHFVFRCELCHATYEAFRIYRARPAFTDAKGASTFGKGVGPDVLKDLSSKDARTRVYSMGRLIRPWIMHRIEETRKTAAEKTAMKKAFATYVREGADLLNAHKKAKDGFYLDWRFYGSCQACEAAKDLGKAGF